MSTNVNQPLGGEKPSFAKGLRLIIEAIPFQYNVAGQPIIAADVDDYFAVNHIKNRKSVKVQGTTSPRVSVLQRARTEMPGIGIYPDYLQMFKWLLLTFELHGKTTANGVDIYDFRKKRRSIPATATATLEAGLDDCADRATGGAVQEMELSSGAEADPEMSVSLVAAEATRGVPMTGAVARSAVLRIIAANVTGPGVYAYKVGSASPVNVTHAVADATGTTVAKLAAIGITATVVGTVATGAGETHRIYNPAATTNATFYGGAITLNPFTSTKSTLETAIQALNGSFAARTVTGTLTNAVAGTDYTGAGNGTAFGSLHDAADPATLFNNNISDSPAFGSNQSAGWDFGNGQTRAVAKLRLHTGPTAVSYPTTAFRLEASNTGAFTGEQTTVVNYSGSALPANTWSEFVVGTTGRAFRLVNTSGGISVISEIELTSADTPGVVDLTINIPSAAGNVADIESNVGTGYTGTSTQPGNAGGAMLITVSAPANSEITVSKVSGDGWSSQIITPGSNGVVEPLPAFPFSASDWTLSRAATLAALANAEAELDGVVKYAIKVANCVMPRSTANGSRTHSKVKKGTYDITLDFTMDDDTNTAESGQMDAIIIDADEQDNNVSKARWYQMHSEADASHYLTFQSWMHVSNDLNATADEEVSVFDVSLEENNYSPELFSTRFLLGVPTGTFSI